MSVIHYAKKDKLNLFMWTNTEKTKCGLNYNSIIEFTTDESYVTCKKCIKLLQNGITN